VALCGSLLPFDGVVGLASLGVQASVGFLPARLVCFLIEIHGLDPR